MLGDGVVVVRCDAYSVSGSLSQTTKAVQWGKARDCNIPVLREQIPPLASTPICD